MLDSKLHNSRFFVRRPHFPWPQKREATDPQKFAKIFRACSADIMYYTVSHVFFFRIRCSLLMILLYSIVFIRMVCILAYVCLYRVLNIFLLNLLYICVCFFIVDHCIAPTSFANYTVVSQLPFAKQQIFATFRANPKQSVYKPHKQFVQNLVSVIRVVKFQMINML